MGCGRKIKGKEKEKDFNGGGQQIQKKKTKKSTKCVSREYHVNHY